MYKIHSDFLAHLRFLFLFVAISLHRSRLMSQIVTHRSFHEAGRGIRILFSSEFALMRWPVACSCLTACNGY